MLHLNVRLKTVVLTSIFCAMLAACGGGSGSGSELGGQGNGSPRAAIDLPGGRLGRDEPLVVRFSKAMDVMSLQLGGEIGAAATPVWASSAFENDFLTLNPPPGGWPGGMDRRLVVDAKDKLGVAVETASASYLVKMAFSPFPAADMVLGQPNFTSSQVNQGGNAGPSTLAIPNGVAISPSGMVFVADTINSRVLAYRSGAASANEKALFALGQPTLADTGCKRGGLENHCQPTAVSINNGKLLVIDGTGSRALVYNTIPTDGPRPADVVLGKADVDDTWDESCTPATMKRPQSGMITPDGKVLVADTQHHRVLIWNQVPTETGRAPDIVLGQFDGTYCAANDANHDRTSDVRPSANTLANPIAVWSDGQRVVVVDADNSRVLVWNSFPSAHFQPADTVLGQGTFTSYRANDNDQNDSDDGKASARTMRSPYGVASNGVQLAISDAGNNRILIWNEFPTLSFQPADFVIGHGNFTALAENDTNDDGTTDGPAANVLGHPAGLTFHGDSLFVADYLNSRVLRFKSR